MSYELHHYMMRRTRGATMYNMPYVRCYNVQHALILFSHIGVKSYGSVYCTEDTHTNILNDIKWGVIKNFQR